MERWELPKGWGWKRLGDICTYTNGVWGDSDPTGIPVLRSTDFLPDGTLNYNSAARLTLDEKAIKKASLIPGDILLERSGGGPKKPVGRVAYFSDTGIYCFGNFITQLRTSADTVYPRYLFMFLYQFHVLGYTEKLQTQTTNIRNLRFQEYLDVEVPIPYPDDPDRSLAEQRRIAARLETLLGETRTLRAEVQSMRRDLAQVMESALAEAFPAPQGEVVEGWSWKRLGDLFDLQQGASMSPNRRRGKNPQPFLRTKNILWGEVDTSDVDLMDFTEDEIERLKLQTGDLLICEGGDVGRTAVWEGQLPLAMYQNHIHRLRRKSEEIEPKFYMYWMKTAYQVFRIYQGEESRTAIPNLSGGRLKNFLVPQTNLAEQRRIVASLERIAAETRAMDALLAQDLRDLDALEQSILAAAFRGEV